MSRASIDNLHQQVSSIARKDFAQIRADFTVQRALDEIRSRGLGERIVYFYVVDGDSRLVGVIPTRRLLTAPLGQSISEIMIKRVISIPENATILEAHEIFAKKKLLALPIVDRQDHQIKGVIDVGMIAEVDFDVMERGRMDEVFETIGFRVSQVRDASPVRAFRFRFPWLLATISSGTICALLASAYGATLEKSLVLAFFLTLALGMGESVGTQSMSVTIQILHSMRPTLKWYFRAFRKELGTALLLGFGCAAIVGLTVWLWRGTLLAAASIAGSILLIILVSALLGLTIPTLVHALKLDPKIAAGPMTLATADICTILIYFSLAMIIL